jgi:hypothetical protein
VETFMTSHDTSLSIGRSVDPQILEAMGKQAARFAESAGISMTDAVVQTIGHVKLNSEQIRRVVEYANIEMFNRKFAAMSGHIRAVYTEGGPADPVQVIQNLNDAARPREVIVDSMEYSMPPDLVKSSSAMHFNFAPERTRAGALGEVYALQSKLSAAHDELIQAFEASKERLSEAFDRLIDQVKSASASGATPEEIYSAWHRVHPELAKIAYDKLKAVMRFDNEKVAGRMINPDSKVVSVFRDFVKESLSAEAHTHALRSVETELSKVSSWLQKHGG